MSSNETADGFLVLLMLFCVLMAMGKRDELVSANSLSPLECRCFSQSDRYPLVADSSLCTITRVTLYTYYVDTQY